MASDGKITSIGLVETASQTEARIRVSERFCEGLLGIEDFSHLIVLYWLHLRDTEEERRTLQVTPRRHTTEITVGVFACRSPTRPNPIGLCVVELLKLEGCTLVVKGLDASARSPIIDIKPYVPRADSFPNARVPEWTHHGPVT